MLSVFCIVLFVKFCRKVVRSYAENCF